MIIPDGPSGFPTVSTSMLNTYGFSGFELLAELEPRGCPSQFEARYVTRTAPKVQSEPMLRGSVMHRAFELLQSEDVEVPLTPDEALQQAWDPALPVELYADCLTALRRYLEREMTPFEQYATIATEVRLDAELYVDPVHGPIHVQGILDRLSIDFDSPNVAHLGDWKDTMAPASDEDVERSVQLMIYAWLVKRCWRQFPEFTREPRVIVHLDLIRHRELRPVEFSDVQLDALHGWVVKTAQTILADDTATPQVNWGCAYCPIRDACPAYAEIPDLALALLKVRPAAPDGEAPAEEEMVAYAADLEKWMMRVNSARLLLEKAFADVDGRFRADAAVLGLVQAGTQEWARVPKWVRVTDTRAVHRLVGDRFYDVVTITKAALEAEAAEHPGIEGKVLGCARDEPQGTKIVRRRKKG